MVLCDYCGEEEGVKKVTNPNMDELDEHPFWMVCNTCSEVIDAQKRLTFGCMLESMDSDRGIGNDKRKDYAKKYISEANDKLAEIAKRTGKTILSAGLYKQSDGHYEEVSIKFKGGSDGFD